MPYGNPSPLALSVNTNLLNRGFNDVDDLVCFELPPENDFCRSTIAVEVFFGVLSGIFGKGFSDRIFFLILAAR